MASHKESPQESKLADTPVAGEGLAGERKPLSPAMRDRLQKVFEHATKTAEKNGYDYAHELFSQSVSGDPDNFVYLQAMLANLQKKYNNNKKGGKLAGMKGSSARKAMKRAAAANEWKGVIKNGCEMLKFNPWDAPTLLAMAEACYQMHIDECQLYYLRWALNADPKNVDVNKSAGQQLARMGQFDQAIICWHRVEEAKPGNEEAAKEISRLTVEKTIVMGGYDREDILGEDAAKSGIRKSPARSPAGPKAGGLKAGGAKGKDNDTADDSAQETPSSPEERTRAAIADNPSEAENYCELSDILAHEHRFDEAEEALDQANQVAGGGDPAIRERVEDLQLRRGRIQVEIAEKRASEDKTDESIELAKRMRLEINQRELEIYAARCEREPGNTGLRFELGIRLKAAGKFAEAVQAFQAARGDVKRNAQVFLELGECFQKIEQYKLAMKEYESAIEACGDRAEKTKKLCLYRAGVLATGLRDLERAEKHLTELAAVDFGYKDVATRLDKINRLRDSG